MGWGSIKVRERILLLLRCLTIVILAILLSKPSWKYIIPSGAKNGWVLLEKESGLPLLEKNRIKIDSLLNTGFELHLLENDFPKIVLTDIEKSTKDTARIHLPTYWALLQKLQERVPPSMPIFVFTGNKLSRFSGTRPTLFLNLHWIVTEEPDTMSKWIESAYSTNDDSLRILNAYARSTGTEFRPQIITATEFQQSAFRGTLIPDTSTLHVAIYSPAGTADGFYAEAAVHAAGQYTRHKLEIRQTTNRDSLPGQADWLFWLSDSTMLPTLHAKNFFVYTRGKLIQELSGIYSLDQPYGPAIPISRIIQSPGDSATNIIWTDGFGRPVLSRDSNRYIFFSHLDPSWNDLPWSASFPQLVLHIIFPDQVTENELQHDLRKIDPAQMIPDFMGSFHSQNEKKSRYDDLTRYFWLLLFMVFCLERYLSLKKKEAFRAR